MASLITAQLLFLESENPSKPISMYINSPGGVVTAGISIYDTMQFIKPAVSTTVIGQAATEYELSNAVYPPDLASIGFDGLLDPWGNPYQYLRMSDASPGAKRKDRFLVPVNSDFDLYSMGPDGGTAAPFTAAMARDDIVRANDGGYVGVAEGY